MATFIFDKKGLIKCRLFSNLIEKYMDTQKIKISTFNNHFVIYEN